MQQKNNFLNESKKVTGWINDYFEKLESLPVKAQVQPKEIFNQLPATPPTKGTSLDELLKDLDEIILPGITHWQHPNFHAFFPANSSIESLFAEFITSAIAAQCMIWETSPAAAELEERVLNWLRDEMKLPNSWEGVIQDTASTATLSAIITAREVSTNFESNENGVPNNLRVYCSIHTHSSIEKAVKIAGMGRKNVVKIPVDKKQAMLPDALEAAILKDIANGQVPCCVIASIGTTSTVAIDPLKPIAEICNKYKIWLHVDAAYAGSTLLLPEYQWMNDGIEMADSFVFNPHKWLFTNFDCSAYFVKDADVLIKTFEILPEYLKTKTRGVVNDYRDWGIPLGRRFRALKLWFVIRSFGMDAIRERLREHIKLNEYFAEEMEASPHFEIMFPPFLSFTGFRLKINGVNELEKINQLNDQFLQKINQSGDLYLSHTRIDGAYIIRMIIAQTYVEKRNIDFAVNTLNQAAKKMIDTM